MNRVLLGTVGGIGLLAGVVFFSTSEGYASKATDLRPSWYEFANSGVVPPNNEAAML